MARNKNRQLVPPSSDHNGIDHLELKKKFIEYKRERAIRESRKNLSAFSQYTNRDYKPAWFHSVIIDHLHQVLEGKLKRLMVFMPPRHGKSEIISRNFPAFTFGQNPNSKIIATSYAASLAEQNNRDVQRVMTCKEFKQVFPNTRLNEKNVRSDAHGAYLRNSEIFEIVNAKGYYKNAGVGGGVTGYGANHILIDDPIKNFQDAYSITVRDSVWNWWRSTLRNRLQKGGSIILIMHRWHKDDLAARILKNDQNNSWKVLKFPAIRGPEDNLIDIRQPGQALWEDEFPIEDLISLKNDVGSIEFEAKYQQDPKETENSIIKGSWFKYFSFSEIPNGVIWNFVIDSAYGNSPTADNSGILAYTIYNGNLYIRAVSKTNLSFPDFIRHVKSWVVENGYNYKSRIYIEPKASGISIAQQLRDTTNLNIILDKSPMESKLLRVQAQTAKYEAGRVYLLRDAHWIEYFIFQCENFTGKENDEDDLVDCLEMAGRKMNKNSNNSSLNQGRK